MLFKTLGAAHVPHDLHELLDFVQIAQLKLEHGKDIERGKLRSLLRLFDRQILSDHALDLQHAVDVGSLSRNIDQISNAARKNVEPRGSGHSRKFKSHFLKLLLD